MDNTEKPYNFEELKLEQLELELQDARQRKENLEKVGYFEARKNKEWVYYSHKVVNLMEEIIKLKNGINK